MGNKYFVSRHAGAKAWAATSGFKFDHLVESLDINLIQVGDIVFGTLPVAVAAEAIQRGARYVHLTLDLPSEARGVELAVDAMTQYGARFEEYNVERRPATLGRELLPNARG